MCLGCLSLVPWLSLGGESLVSLGGVSVVAGCCLGGALVVSEMLCRWCLLAVLMSQWCVSGFGARWCLSGVSMMSRWCLAGDLVLSWRCLDCLLVLSRWCLLVVSC